MVHADCGFRMGRTHLVCQDYAAVSAGEFPCVLVADGCSSSPDTDIGARLLVKTAQQFASSLPDPCHDEFRLCLEKYHADVIMAARCCAGDLGLADTALDATLLTLAGRGGWWFASVFGDGVIVAKERRFGTLEVTVVSYPNGYPYYPNYLADVKRKRTLLAQANSDRKVEGFRLPRRAGRRRAGAPSPVDPPPSSPVDPFLPRGEGMDDSEGMDAFSETCPADFHCQYVMGEVAEYEWVAVLSDGIHSFYASAEQGTAGTNTPLALPDVLEELLTFKTTTGQFVQRRMQRFQQQCAVRGWQHHDDLALGVLSC